tara:strand:+ start:179 stop:517 length:339 start_codon:yes stop_codon:yes gene_type:complete
MSPLNILQDWKSKPYQKTNYENIHAYYGDQKYIRMKPKSQISLTPGFLHIIIKHPKEWVHQNFKLKDEVTLKNETPSILYYTLIESLISNDEKEYKLHVKNGVPKEDEEWLN